MAITAEARIVVRGGAEALKTVSGVSRKTTEASAASKKAAKDEEKAAKAGQQAKERAEKAKQRALLATEREVKRAARAEQREAEKLAQHYQRLAIQSANYRIRQEQRMTREAQREAQKRGRIEQEAADKRSRLNNDNSRRGRGALGAVVGGVVAGAATAVNTARSIGGIRSMPERVQAANDFRERLVVVGSQAGLDADGRKRVEGQINSASMATGKDQGDLLNVLEVGQAKFNDLQFFADHLEEIATIARASGSDAGEFAQALGYAKQAFGLSGEEAMEAANLMVAAAAKGSIEVKDFAKSFAPVAGLFAQNTGTEGISGFKQLLGVAQGAGTLGKTPDETATLVERFVAAIADPEVVKDLRTKGGVDIKGMQPTQIIEALAGSKKFAKSGVKQDIFKDVREQQVITALVSAFNRVKSGQEGAIDAKTISEVNGQEGRDMVTKTMGELQGSGALEFDKRNAELQAHTLENLGTYNDQLLKVVDASVYLETSMGSLALWADAIAATGIGAGVGGVLAGGGGGGGAGGGLMGTLGGMLPMLGNAGLIGAAGIAGYQFGNLIGADKWGEWIGNKLAGGDYDLPEGVERTDVRTPMATPGVPPERVGVGTVLSPTAVKPGTGPLSNRALDGMAKHGGDHTKLLAEIRDLLRTGSKPPPYIDQSARNGARP